jgi:HEAT repeat protein
MTVPFEKVEGSDLELVVNALAIADPEDWAYQNVVTELQDRGGRSILRLMLNLCDSDEESRQRLGLDVLAQLGVAVGETFIEESFATVVRLCETTTSYDTLQSGITALGYFHDHQGLPIILRNLEHPNEGVRWHVALALPKVAGEPVDPAVIDALMTLMVDESAHVRDWATFGLGTMKDVDNPEIRAALWSRVDDDDPETIFEALRGLGGRHAPGVVERIVELLNKPQVNAYLIDAAVAVPDNRLVDPLKAILANGWIDENITAEWLIVVIESCENVTWRENS